MGSLLERHPKVRDQGSAQGQRLPGFQSRGARRRLVVGIARPAVGMYQGRVYVRYVARRIEKANPVLLEDEQT